MDRGAHRALKGIRKTHSTAAQAKGGQRIWPKDSPDARRAVTSLSSESRPKVSRQARSRDMGTLKLRTVGRKSKKIRTDRLSDTSLLMSRSTTSKALSNKRTPEKSARPKRN